MPFFTNLRSSDRVKRFLWSTATALLALGSAQAQMNVVPNQTATQLAQRLTGPGVIVTNATLVCPTNASGDFTVGPLPSNLGIDSGIVMTSGRAQTVGATAGVNGPQTLFAATSNNAPGDADLTTLAGQTTFDACKLEFDFVPAGDTIKFDYVFGSEEYDSYSCTSFNDVFGFFISGPGIVGQRNIALIPGTTIPVAVNSTTNPAITMPFSTAMCNAMGTGSPFAQYYVNNTNGTTVTYYGFTTVFTAVSAVVPCTTYHLKLAIADAADGTLDSGVWLKAGSLTSNAINVNPVGGGGLAAPNPYVVRNCLPGQFVFSRPSPRVTPLTIKYIIGGSAVNGVDYTQIPDSVVIPSNGTTTTLNIQALAPPNGTDSVKLYILSPYSCGTGAPNIIDSATLVILDSIAVDIVEPDTSICVGECVQFTLQPFPTNNLLNFTWLPTSGLTPTTGDTVVACPQVTTTYQVAATLPGSGCPPSYSHQTVTVVYGPDIDAGPDTTTCVGVPYTFPTTISPANQNYNITWTPATGLNNPNILQPTATATAVGTTTYIISANPGAAGCTGYDTVTLKVIPDDFTLFNGDTAVCKGTTVQVAAIGDPTYTYTWTPPAGVSNVNSLTPAILADTTERYYVTASFPGCPNITKNFLIDVQPNPIVNIGVDRDKCQWDTLQLQAQVSPGWYPFYAYDWQPSAVLENPTTPAVIFFGQQDEDVVLTVRTPAGCIGRDTARITVRQGNFATLSPIDTAICPNDTVQFIATGGVDYNWTPGIYLSDSASATPVARAITDMDYTLLVTDQYGCFDTLYTGIIVHPEAVLELGEPRTIYPGEGITANPATNCLYFSWQPPLGLSSDSMANPTIQPPVNTRYFVTAATENGCIATDSLDIIVSAESLLNVPNAFTPASAGPNNTIKVERLGAATLNSFRIYNRWGTKVFESADINQGWDGSYNGQPQPMGVYVYIVEATTASGRRFNKQGNITLIR